MQRVIGLDIGSFSIKAVEIFNTFKSYEITNFSQLDIPSIPGVPEELILSTCLQQLFSENALEADRIVTAMPGQFIASRVLSLGFSDPRKVEAAVLSELEDALPFSIDDMIIDHQILGTIKEKTIVLAVMTRKDFLRNFLSLLQKVSIDPKIVDVDSLAFYNLSSYLSIDSNKNICLVDLGHEKTSLTIVKNGVLRMFRTINVGGKYITEFLARDLETTFHEAQRIKHRVSRVISTQLPAEDLKGDDLFVAERMTLAFNAIIRELGRTFYAYKQWEREPIGELVLSGGTSQLNGLPELLSEQLEIPTSRIDLPGSTLKLSPELLSSKAIIPQSLAIGMRTVSQAKSYSQVNLRQNEFAFVQNYEGFLKAASFFGKIAAVCGLLLFVSYGIKYAFYQKHIDKLEALYRAELYSIVSDKAPFERQRDFQRLRLEAEKSLKGEVDKFKNAFAQIKTQNSGSPAMELLSAISQSIPSDVKLDLTLFDYKRVDDSTGTVSIRAETDGYEQQASVIEALKKVASLENVEERSSGAKPGTDGKIIEFSIQATHRVGS